MTSRAIAKRIAGRSWKLKDKLIDMHHEAKDAGLEQLAEELTSAFMMMDEVIGEAERKEKTPAETGLAVR